jgi:hypothetical protein
MSRPSSPSEYLLLINLKDGEDLRRFCQVLVRGDDVYIFQPCKGGPVKTTYHKSGQQHVKIGQGPPLFPVQLDPTAAILTEENPWAKSFENFVDLLPYKGETANDVFEIDPSEWSDPNAFAQVSIGRAFDQCGWTLDEVDQITLRQQVFVVPNSASGLQVCVRILRLQPSA